MDMTDSMVKTSEPRALIACVMMYMLAPVGMSLIPLLVGAGSDNLGLTQKQAGFLATADLAGIALAAVICTIWIRTWAWRPLAVVGIAIIVLSNLASIQVDSYALLCVMRFITEFGQGIIFSLALVSIGDTSKPDRYFAFGIGLTVFISIAFFLVLPGLIQEHGLPALFITHALVALAVLPLVLWFPASALPLPETSAKDHGSMLPLFVAMVAFMFFMATEGGLWAYMERIGNNAGFTPEFVGQALAATQVTSVMGALLASAVSTRYGRTLPIVAGSILFIVAMFMLMGKGTVTYVSAVCLTQFCYIFVVPYLLLICVELDQTGRLYVLSIAFKLGGMSLGPSVVAQFLAPGSYTAVSWVGSVFLMTTLLLVVPLAARLDNKQRISTELEAPA